MAKLKYEFLDRYHKANGFPVRNRLFGNIAAISRLGSFMAPVSNLVMRSPTFADLMERFANIDRRRKLPPFASQTFRQWFKARGGSIRPPGGKGQVLLFVTPSPTTTTRRSEGRPRRSWRDSGTRSPCLIRSAAGGPCSPPA